MLARLCASTQAFVANVRALLALSPTTLCPTLNRVLATAENERAPPESTRSQPRLCAPQSSPLDSQEVVQQAWSMSLALIERRLLTGFDVIIDTPFTILGEISCMLHNSRRTIKKAVLTLP